jgi:hypothetical protein
MARKFDATWTLIDPPPATASALGPTGGAFYGSFLSHAPPAGQASQSRTGPHFLY